MQKFIFFMLALLSTLCIMLIGVAIGEGSAIGIILSIVGTCAFIFIGFKLKRNLANKNS